MLCEICNKNEATIHIQEIVGGKKKSMHLCSSCAAAKHGADGLDLGPFNLAGLLYKLSGSQADDSGAENDDDFAKLVCPECSWTGQKLKATGKLGCGNCYKVFAPLLSEVLKNMHHGSSHVGKQPSGKSTELGVLHRELADLQKKLQHAVDAEEYEQAAVLRDRINELKLRCNDNAGSEGEAQ